MTETEPQKRKPIVHRKPVLATVRQPYGTAFRCGKPDCGRPLYKMNDDTGETLLNSRVSHICARSEGGPRWDPDMSEEDNRSDSNLIPLCMEHADEIDVTPERYPVELLHEWKHAQITEQLGPPPLGGLRDRRLTLHDGLSGRPIVQALAMSAHDLVDGVGEVVEQVEPVGDLDCVRCAKPGAFSATTGAVTADHLGARGERAASRRMCR